MEREKEERRVTLEFGEKVQEHRHNYTKPGPARYGPKAGSWRYKQMAADVHPGSRAHLQEPGFHPGPMYHSYGVYWPCATPPNIATARHCEQSPCPGLWPQQEPLLRPT